MKKIIIMYDKSHSPVEIMEVVEMSEEKIAEFQTRILANKQKAQDKQKEKDEKAKQEKLALEERLKNLEKEIAYLKGE